MKLWVAACFHLFFDILAMFPIPEVEGQGRKSGQFVEPP
jgi:hypothetical protein